MKMKISSLLILVLVGGLFLPHQPAGAATPKPTLAQIEAAKKAEAAKKKDEEDAAARKETMKTTNDVVGTFFAQLGSPLSAGTISRGRPLWLG